MPRNKAEVHVGRLVEVTLVDALETDKQADDLMRAIRHAVEKVPADQMCVTAADWRQLTVMSPAASQRMLAMLRHANPRTERSARLYSDASPTAIMQFFRLLKDAQHPNRQMFASPHEMADWLGKSLNGEETRRLQQFLGVYERPSWDGDPAADDRDRSRG